MIEIILAILIAWALIQVFTAVPELLGLIIWLLMWAAGIAFALLVAAAAYIAIP